MFLPLKFIKTANLSSSYAIIWKKIKINQKQLNYTELFKQAVRLDSRRDTVRSLV